MHTYPPPIDALKEWLEEYPSTNDDGNYGHLLLEQKEENGSQHLIDELLPYFESAHLDAREHFHEMIGIDLHPDANSDDSYAQYPNFLPESAKSGLFGEVMAGLISESYDIVGGYEWRIPVFLFRFHSDAEKYLFDLARDSNATRSTFGRFGTDFLGLSLQNDGSIDRIIAGEAKWRKTLTLGVMDTLLQGQWVTKEGEDRYRSGKGIWHEVNKDTPVPHAVRQLQRLLKETAPEEYSATILSMDKALTRQNPVEIPRTDLIIVIGNSTPTRQDTQAFIEFEEVPEEYTAGNDLQVVEVFLKNGHVLIESIYQQLWSEENGQ